MNFVETFHFVQESEKSKKTIASIIERPNDRSAKLLKEKEEQQKRLKQKNHEEVISAKTNGSKLMNGCDVRLVKNIVTLFLIEWHCKKVGNQNCNINFTSIFDFDKFFSKRSEGRITSTRCSP